MLESLREDAGQLKTLVEVLDLFTAREKEQRERVDLLEREVAVVARAEVESSKSKFASPTCGGAPSSSAVSIGACVNVSSGRRTESVKWVKAWSPPARILD